MQIIPDHLVLYLQLKVLGTLFSAIAYGIVAVLSGNCLYLLQRKRGTQSYRMRILLLIYVTVMLMLSTFTLFQSIYQVVGFMFPPEILPAGLMYLPITLTLTIWGENGFMVRILIPR
jgi:cellulose synthase/poly-beta-1,6-N-acetylglucosamine synthase-like glycosyltransferase